MGGAKRTGDDTELMIRAARLHFEFGLTHEETAAQLSLSRIKVTRLLKKAREQGIVRIWVALEVGIFADLEARLAALGQLREAIIVPTAKSAEETRQHLARGMARYLERILRDGMVVAVSLSRTIALVARELSPQAKADVMFVSLSGSLPAGTGSPVESVQGLAAAFGGSLAHLHAPLLVAEAQMAQDLMKDPAIATALHRAATADIVLAGIGSLTDRLDLTDIGLPTAEALARLRHQDVIGDIGGRYFDRRGLPVQSEIDARLIGLDLHQFKKIPNRVVAAGGPTKVEAVAAALRGSLVSVLVTDQETGMALVDQLGKAPPEAASDPASVTATPPVTVPKPDEVSAPGTASLAEYSHLEEIIYGVQLPEPDGETTDR
ncbi:MAG TPA: sugar-binding domain-containing protein [Acidobacteriaceae bacterium]|nr:sugar-binding domain-containing protein [Acidobacteriaceae bacterium]